MKTWANSATVAGTELRAVWVDIQVDKGSYRFTSAHPPPNRRHGEQEYEEASETLSG